MERRKAFLALCSFLLPLFCLPIFPLEGEDEPSLIEIPEDFSGVQDVLDLESGAAMEKDLETPEKKDSYLSFMDSLKKMRMLETDSDIFSANQISSGGRRLVSFANGKIQRRFYDENLRLEKIEYWRLSSSSADSKLERTVTYNPPLKGGGLNSIYERNYFDSTETRSFFHPNGLIKSRRKNYFDKEEKISAFEIYTCSYDSKNRLVQERLQRYSVDNKAVSLSEDELHVTKYSGENISETSYYKNSVLRVRTFYMDGNPEEYARATYFDGGMIVRDFYKGNVKISSTVDNGRANGK